MVFCGKCGTDNPEDNDYCLRCGTKLVKRKDAEWISDAEAVHQDGKVDDSGRAERYRIPLILCGFATCLIMFMAVFGVNIQYMVTESVMGPGTHVSLSVWDLIKLGHSDGLAASMTVVLALAILAVASPVFGFLSAAVFTFASLYIPSFMAGYTSGGITLYFQMWEGAWVTLGLLLAVIYIVLATSLYLMIMFDREYPGEGFFGRIVRVWKP